MRRRVWLILAAAAIATGGVFVVTRWSEPALPDPPVLMFRADADPEIARLITDAAIAVLEERSNRPRWVKLAMVYQANYTSGLRILEFSALATDTLSEVSFFDTYPEDNAPSFDGAWGVYPFFPSGTIVVSDINRGLFVLSPD